MDEQNLGVSFPETKRGSFEVLEWREGNNSQYIYAYIVQGLNLVMDDYHFFNSIRYCFNIDTDMSAIYGYNSNSNA